MKVFDEILEQVNPLLDFNFIHFNEILQNKTHQTLQHETIVSIAFYQTISYKLIAKVMKIMMIIG